jgi:hypothetical protein
MISDYEIKSKLTWNEFDEAVMATVDVNVVVENYKSAALSKSVDSDLASIEGLAIRVEMFMPGRAAPLSVSSVTCSSTGSLPGVCIHFFSFQFSVPFLFCLIVFFHPPTIFPPSFAYHKPYSVQIGMSHTHKK